MSNFSGIKKSAKPFQPQGSGAPDVGIVRNVAGGYEPVNYVEVKKANEPTLPTDEPRPTDGKGENELGLSGQVDHPDNSGSAKYIVQTVSRIYRQTLAGRNAEVLTQAERLALRDQILDGVGPAQRAFVYELASFLAGLTDELDGKAAPTGTLIKSAGTGVTVYCRILHKNEALREVHGVIAEEQVDKSGEVLDYSSSEPYFKKWSAEAYERTAAAGLPASYGNVREQHSPRAVGKLTSIQFDSVNKRIPVVAKIVDDETWRKIQAGVLTGFSIGGSYLNKWGDGEYVRYTAKPAEVSIVDNPCMPGATFSMVKDAPQTDFDKVVAQLHATTEKLTARVQAMLKAQGANDQELSPTRFKTMHEWREAIAKAELKKALANGTPASFEGGNIKSNFKTLQTGEAPSGDARKHYADLERKPFQPR